MRSAPVFTVPKFSAVCVGAVCFGVLYALFYWAVTKRLWPTSNVSALFLSMFLVPGFVLGLIARDSSVINGLILGMLVPVIITLEGILFAGATDFPPLSEIFR